jgi:hypothetical protein
MLATARQRLSFGTRAKHRWYMAGTGCAFLGLPSGGAGRRARPLWRPRQAHTER